MKIQNYELRTRTLAFMALLFILPGVLFYAVGARSIEPINGQDGYAYIGIVARTSDFLSRFPDSYFGTRFGYIFPSDLFHWMFGFEVGHHVLRFISLGFVAVFLTIRGHIRPGNVIVMVLLLSSSPIVLVSTFSTYTMSLGALFLLFGVLVLAIYRNEDRMDFLLVGLSSALFAMAWNSHLQLLLPSAVLLVVMIIDRVFEKKHGKLTSLFWYSIAGLGGAILVAGTGALFLGSRYGLWNPWAPAFGFVDSSAGDAFKSNGFNWITWRHYVLLAPLAILVGGGVCLTEKNPYLRTVMRRMTIASSSLLSVYVLYQWGLRNIMFETYFHSSGLMVCCYVTLLIATGILLNRLNNDLGNNIAIIGSFFSANIISTRVETPFGWVIFATTTVLLLFMLTLFFRKELIGVALVSLTALTSWITVSSPHDFPATAGGYRTDPLYDQALFSFDKSSMNRGSALNQISLMLPSLPRDIGEIRIWFDPLSRHDQLSAPFPGSCCYYRFS